MRTVLFLSSFVLLSACKGASTTVNQNQVTTIEQPKCTREEFKNCFPNGEIRVFCAENPDNIIDRHPATCDECDCLPECPKALLGECPTA